MSFQLRTLPLAHDWLRQVIQPGDTVIDGTVGNGHDTLFLAQHVGAEGRVHGFDIQPAAAETTARLLNEHHLSAPVTLHTACHSRMADYLEPQPIAAAMFNLGYLPRGDKSIITQQETTLPALDYSLRLLRLQGLLTIMCYPGHEGGESEASAVEEWARDLSSDTYRVMRLTPHNPRSAAPFLLAIQRYRQDT